MRQRLGHLEMQFLAYLQMRKQSTVETGQLQLPLRITATQERELFSRLARGGLIARVRPGLYLVPPRLPLGGTWTPDEGLALTALMADRDGRYQVCGPNAFNYYGYDEQIPVRVYAYNNRISGERTIGTVALTLIKVDGQRLGSVEKFRPAEGRMLIYASRVRTLVDAVYDWSRFNSLPRAYEWILDDLRAQRIDPAQLVRTALQFGDLGTRRRLGVLLEQAGVSDASLRKLERSLTPTSALIPWVPNRPKRGTVDRRWGVVVNDQIRTPGHPRA